MTDPFDTVRLWIDDVYGDEALAALASIKEERDGWKARAEAAERERDEAIRRYALYSELTEEEAARNVEQYLALASGKDESPAESSPFPKPQMEELR